MNEIVAWLNVIILILVTLLTGYFYIRSVQPVALARRIGTKAWQRCFQYRVVAIVFMSLTVINYLVYLFYPLPLGIGERFPWPWPLSAILGFIILMPAFYLLLRGSRDAGSESIKPSPEHEMYGGIYEHMRHPQAVGESITWLGGAFLLNSPFLVLYSLVWLPLYYVMCMAEEKDLLIRFGQDYREYRERVGFFCRKRL